MRNLLLVPVLLLALSLPTAASLLLEMDFTVDTVDSYIFRTEIGYTLNTLIAEGVRLTLEPSFSTSVNLSQTPSLISQRIGFALELDTLTTDLEIRLANCFVSQITEFSMDVYWMAATNFEFNLGVDMEYGPLLPFNAVYTVGFRWEFDL